MHMSFSSSPGNQATYRYELLARLLQARRRNKVRLLAFGFDQAGVRVVIEGWPARLASVERSLLAFGSCRGRREAYVEIRDVLSEDQLEAAITWAHRGPADADPGLAGPLASPWSSHRDLLGYRKAPFYDRSVLVGRVNLGQVHRRCGGGPPPTLAQLRRSTPPDDGKAEPEDLLHLSRVAGSVLGREPADPKCFSLFRSAGQSARVVIAAHRRCSAGQHPACATAVRGKRGGPEPGRHGPVPPRDGGSMPVSRRTACPNVQYLAHRPGRRSLHVPPAKPPPHF